MKTIAIIILALMISAIILVGYATALTSDSIILQGQIRDTQWEQDSINKQTNHSLRDYQLDVQPNDTVYVFDNTRLVGKFKLDYDNDPVSTLIEEDNQ